LAWHYEQKREIRKKNLMANLINKKQKTPMPPAGQKNADRAKAHLKWAARYNDDGEHKKAAAHFGRALEYDRRDRNAASSKNQKFGGMLEVDGQQYTLGVDPTMAVSAATVAGAALMPYAPYAANAAIGAVKGAGQRVYDAATSAYNYAFQSNNDPTKGGLEDSHHEFLPEHSGLRAPIFTHMKQDRSGDNTGRTVAENTVLGSQVPNRTGLEVKDPVADEIIGVRPKTDHDIFPPKQDAGGIGSGDKTGKTVAENTALGSQVMNHTVRGAGSGHEKASRKEGRLEAKTHEGEDDQNKKEPAAAPGGKTEQPEGLPPYYSGKSDVPRRGIATSGW